MAVKALSHNITRHVGFNDDAPGTFQTIGSGPGGGDGNAGLQYEGGFSYTRRINATGSDHGVQYTHNATISLLAAGNLIYISKGYTVLTGLTEQKVRVGSAGTAYHEYLVGDDGSEGDNQDFLAPPKGGYIIQPINVGLTAWIQRGITGSPDITLADVFATSWNVTATTGAGLSGSFDAIDLTDDGLFVVGGDSTDPDAEFEDFRVADEDAGLTGAERVGLWTSQAGIFFVFGPHVIGRTDAATVTATEFSDDGKTIVFPGGFVDEGWNGFEFDLGNASTIVSLLNCSFVGRGRRVKKVFFDTDVDVNDTTDEIEVLDHELNTGDQVVYSAEGGSEDIGPTATNGESKFVGSGGPGTGANWYVRKVTDDTFALHPTAGDAYANTNEEPLTASTAGNEELHSLTRAPDTRPDILFVGTTGTITTLGNTFDNCRNITLTSIVDLDQCKLNNCNQLTLASGGLTDSVINKHTTEPGRAFMLVTSAADLVDVSGNSFTAPTDIQDGGHAIELTTTAATVTFTGNTFTGYGPNPAEFEADTDVNGTTDVITLPTGHGYVNGDPVFYNDRGGTAIGGLTDQTLYYVGNITATSCEMFISLQQAITGTNQIDLTAGSSETHAIESANAAIFNDTGSGTVTINVEDGDSPTIRNGAGATTIVQNTVTVLIQGLTEGAAVKVIATDTVGAVTIGDVLLEALADNNGEAQFSHNFEGNLTIDIRARQQGLPNAAIADDNGTFTDETGAANSSSNDDMTLLPLVPVVNEDNYLFGHAEQFGKIKLDISTPGVGAYEITWQYRRNDASWQDLSGVTDNTDSFKNPDENTVEFTIPGDWGTDTFNSQGPFFYIRAELTTGGVTNEPVGRKCKLDVNRYLPFLQANTIISTGLTVTASWVRDLISTF